MTMRHAGKKQGREEACKNGGVLVECGVMGEERK
jgi:hypothetical protein